MNNKKKYLSILTGFTNLDASILINNFLIEKLSKMVKIISYRIKKVIILLQRFGKYLELRKKKIRRK